MAEEDLVATKWTPRRELALPNELLHKIILLLISDCIHSICLSDLTVDTRWEKRVIDILHQVSPAFRAISSELAAMAFDIPKDIREDNQRLLPILREKIVYLSNLACRFRDPSDWHSTIISTLDSSPSAPNSYLILSYTLYLSSICLRRNARRCPPSIFESTHNVIVAALRQCEGLCQRVMPIEITAMLRQGIQEELEIARYGQTLVQSFIELNNHANSMRVLQPSQDQDGAGPLAGVRSLIHTSLLKVEGAYEHYMHAYSGKPPRTEPYISELPGIIATLRALCALEFVEDEYNLTQRIPRVVSALSTECPFMTRA